MAIEVEVLASDGKVDFAPGTLIEEVIQNVRTICTTAKCSVPMDRQFGINAVMLDQPTPKARAALQAEIVQAIRKYEPRCRVKKVIFSAGLDGNLAVKVRVAISKRPHT